MVNKIRYCEDEKAGSSKPIFLLEFVDCIDIPKGLFHSGNLFEYILCQSDKLRNLDPNDFLLEYKDSKINIFIKKLESKEEYAKRLAENDIFINNKNFILDILSAVSNEFNWRKLERNGNPSSDGTSWYEDVLFINKDNQKKSEDIIKEISKIEHLKIDGSCE